MKRLFKVAALVAALIPAIYWNAATFKFNCVQAAGPEAAHHVNGGP